MRSHSKRLPSQDSEACPSTHPIKSFRLIVVLTEEYSHRWVELKNEYLARQEALYEAMRPGGSTSMPTVTASRATQRSAEPASIQPVQNTPRDREAPPHLARRSGNEDANSTAKGTPIVPVARQTGAEYPQGCLLFVKNVHPQTNKTALKSLFGHILNLALGDTASSISSSTGKGTAASSRLDYVDWSKGMSSVCHFQSILRCGNSHHDSATSASRIQRSQERSRHTSDRTASYKQPVKTQLGHRSHALANRV